MKKIYNPLITILILNIFLSLNAQSSSINEFYLSNYSFAMNIKEALISKVIVNSSKPYDLKLVGKNAKLFMLKKNNILLTEKGMTFFENQNQALLSIQMINNGKSIKKTFLLVKDEFVKNGVIAHRGAWKNTNAPQNSIASLQNAINLGCEGSEFDVHLTADEVVVVNHDHKFQGLHVEKSKYKDLQKLALKNGEPIPTLEAFLKKAMQQQKTLLVCELKKSSLGKERSSLLAEKVLEKINELKANAWLVYISFDYDILKKIVEIESSSRTMYLSGNIAFDKLKTDGMYGANYHYSVYQKNNNWVYSANSTGIKTGAWTVNDNLIMDYLAVRKINYITTDEPELLLNRLPSYRNSQTKTLVWSEEFNYNGLPDSTKWNYQVGGHGWGNNELQFYTEADSQNVKVENGHLTITALKKTMGKREYTSARLVTKNKGDWLYGKIEIRAKLPKGRGIWPAIWMLPTDNIYGGWPSSGEIDIMEHVGYMPDSVFMTVHTKSFNHMIGTSVSKGIKLANIYSDFHTYTIDWNEERIDFYVDGIKHHTFDNLNKSFKEWPFDKRFYLVLNIAVGGGWGGKKGVDNNIFPTSMEIDYVRVFQ